MTTRTLADEIITIIQAHSNNNPAPETCTIKKTYTNGYVDIETSNGKINYLECIGATKTGYTGLLVYPNGNLNNPIVVSIGDYYTQSEISTLLNTKQDKLVSGTNIKTINNNSLLGSGNITIQGGGGGGITAVGSFSINDNGHLIAEIPSGMTNPYSINSSGHLIYDTSSSTEEET